MYILEGTTHKTPDSVVVAHQDCTEPILCSAQSWWIATTPTGLIRNDAPRMYTNRLQHAENLAFVLMRPEEQASQSPEGLQQVSKRRCAIGTPCQKIPELVYFRHELLCDDICEAAMDTHYPITTTEEALSAWEGSLRRGEARPRYGQASPVDARRRRGRESRPPKPLRVHTGHAGTGGAEVRRSGCCALALVTGIMNSSF